LFVEGLPIPHAASDELWPLGHNWQWIRSLWQKSPKRRMVPAKFMKTAISVVTYALSQLLYFVNKFFTRHLVKVSVHELLPQMNV
jgi:hypothetical protein